MDDFETVVEGEIRLDMDRNTPVVLEDWKWSHYSSYAEWWVTDLLSETLYSIEERRLSKPLSEMEVLAWTSLSR